MLRFVVGVVFSRTLLRPALWSSFWSFGIAGLRLRRIFLFRLVCFATAAAAPTTPTAAYFAYLFFFFFVFITIVVLGNYGYVILVFDYGFIFGLGFGFLVILRFGCCLIVTVAAAAAASSAAAAGRFFVFLAGFTAGCFALLRIIFNPLSNNRFGVLHFVDSRLRIFGEIDHRRVVVRRLERCDRLGGFDSRRIGGWFCFGNRLAGSFLRRFGGRAATAPRFRRTRCDP